MAGKGKASRKKHHRGRVVTMSEEARQGLAGQSEAFQEKFGRTMRPDEPVFFDSNADTPEVISEDTIRAELTDAAVKARIDPAIIYAMHKTGMILTAATENLWSEDALAAWNAAIEEYHSLNSKPPS